VHPHIAPINGAAANAGYSQPPGTPQLNIPDGIWNHGEGFLAQSTSDADHGGHLGSVEPGLELGDIFGVEQTIGGTPGWKQVQHFDVFSNTTINLWRFQGYLRPGQLGPYMPRPLPPGPSAIEDAAFELFLPDPIPSTTQIVLAIGVWATTAKPSIAAGGRHAYPGASRVDGLAGPNAGPPLRHFDPAICQLAAQGGKTLMISARASARNPSHTSKARAGLACGGGQASPASAATRGLPLSAA
jgi:hypothetical protein